MVTLGVLAGIAVVALGAYIGLVVWHGRKWPPPDQRD